MYKLFELGIFRKDEPYELVYTDAFNDAIEMTDINFNVVGFPSIFKYLLRCVTNFFLSSGMAGMDDIWEDSEIVIEITAILSKLDVAGLLKNAQKNVTEEDRKRTKERIDQELKKVFGKEIA